MKDNKSENNLWQRIKDRIVQDVPIEIASCEYDCRRHECLMNEWDSCPNRKWYVELHRGAKQ